MRILIRPAGIAAFIACTVLVAGCIPTKRVQPQYCVAFVNAVGPQVKGTYFAPRIKEAQENLKGASDRRVEARLHLYLAALQMDHRNPRHDYRNAYLNLKDYIEKASQEDRCKDVATSIMKLLVSKRQSCRMTSNEIDAMEAELGECKQRARQLQELDLKMERKRRSLK